MERFYFAYNWGWLRWERWKDRPRAYRFTAKMSYVSLSDYPSGGGENWRMIDCRMWTNIQSENGERTAQIGWP